jgi:hemerythrin-like domain-containing protein
VKITDALLGEHGAFYAQFARLEERLPHATSAAEIRDMAALLSAALVTHARLEDELLFERMRVAGADGGLLDMMEDEHASIARLLARAEGSHHAAAARDDLLEAVAQARDHFGREERFAFPLADSLLSAATLSELGTAWSARREVHLETP